MYTSLEERETEREKERAQGRSNEKRQLDDIYFTLTDLKWPTCSITWSIYLYRGPAFRRPSGEINPAQSTDLCGFIGDDGDDG